MSDPNGSKTAEDDESRIGKLPSNDVANAIFLMLIQDHGRELIFF